MEKCKSSFAMEKSRHSYNVLVASHVLLLLGICSLQTGRASPIVPALIVFGDSTADVGMNNGLRSLLRCNFRPYGRDFKDGTPTGRFCNGMLSIDYVALKIGLPYFPFAYLDPEAKGENIVYGMNFASGASGYYDNTANLYNVISLTKQLEYFEEYRKDLAEVVGSANASSILSEALYVISTGNNDYVLNYYFNPLLKYRMNEDQYRGFLVELAADFVQKLYGLGARRIGILSLPPLGCLPAMITLFGRGESECVEFLNAAAIAFNRDLLQRIEIVNALFSDAKIVCLETYNILFDVISNPSKYGFEDVNRGCCGTGALEVALLCNRLLPTCPNASKYIFWDSFHPSSAVYELVANELFNVGLPQLL